MSRFFIDRPIFAWVIAILIMLAGALSIINLPVTQYPDVAAPAISISGFYPGASAQTVQDTVVQIVEQQMNGLDGFRYISSESASDGSFNIVVTFDQGTDPDIAQVQVQNKLQLAMPMLPNEVQSQGLNVVKFQVNFMLVLSLYSEDGRFDNAYLGNYLVSNIKDPISRTKGVGEVMVMASQYAMRIWLKPDKLYSYQLMPQDIIQAVSTQNVQISSGQLGGLPTRDGVQLNATVIAKSKMTTVKDFEEILLKVNPDGSQIRLKDVATISLGNENYAISGLYNGHPSAGMALRLAAGANVLEASQAVKKTIAELEPFFPEGVKVAYPYETGPSVQASISSVVRTLFEAIFLVFIIMYLFLQDFRATIIPTIAVPVVLLGTFAVLFAFGYTINIMTMFAMVLAIGLLVDDAIVVVENVERIMADEGLSPKEATIKSMEQIQGALVGIGLVICAVFFPMAFFAGSTGVIYRQFSITVIAAMSLSVLIALIFTPALCATFLKPISMDKAIKKGFFGWFNRTFYKGIQKYTQSVTHILNRKRRFGLLVFILLAVTSLLYVRIPSSFLPDEDQGNMMVLVQLPSNATTERTQTILKEVANYFLNDEQEAVRSIMTISGFSFAGRGQNAGMAFVSLKPFKDRNNASLSAFAVAQRAWQRFSVIKEARIIPIVPPAIAELGNATGFDFYLQDRGGVGHETLMNARNMMLGQSAQNKSLAMVRPNGFDDQPQYKLTIDDEKARSLSTSLSDINNTMSVAWGSAYINDFIDGGRVKKVYVQGEDLSRISPEDFNKWHVRNANGDMVPFAAFSSGEWIIGSPKMERYNGVAAVEILGQGAPGVSTGEAMKIMEQIAQGLPQGVGLSFTGLSYEERLAGSQTGQLYAISLIIVFLCLAALYESWSIPISVMMMVPFGIFGTIVATLLSGHNNDVFFQVGMLTVMGLAAKNAILIVEFAKDQHEKENLPLFDAAIRAAKMRLRPIIMTSMAFVFGVLPMATASGASSASQQALGVGVVGGTLAATFLGIFFIPMFYVVVAGLFQKNAPKTALKENEPPCGVPA